MGTPLDWPIDHKEDVYYVPRIPGIESPGPGLGSRARPTLGPDCARLMGRQMSRGRRRRRRREEKAVPAAPPEPPARRDRLWSRVAALAGKGWVPPVTLVLLIFAVYARSISYPFINFDDSKYICEDVRVQELSAGNAWRILTTPFMSNYHPVTTFTFALDRAVWGGWLPGFRLTQLAFYAGGVVLLYYLFQTILASRPAAFAAAAIYATHTIHVESVAWLASRKDVVCLVFYAAAILAYVRYTREKDRPYRHYALFAALAAAAMFAKGYAAVLPVVLLAYDACFSRKIGRRQILDKLPLLAVALAVTIIMLAAQEKHAAPISAPITGWYRFVRLCKVFAAYVGLTILPVRLSGAYPVHEDWLHPSAALLGALLGTGAVAGFFALRRRLPAAAFGIALFVLPLGTVMNTFFTLRTWMTDRYLFFPTIGSSLALAAGGLWLYRNKDLLPARRRWAIPAAAAGAVALYAALTIARVGVWQSGITFWSDVIRKQNDIAGSGPVTASDLRGRRLKVLIPRLLLSKAYNRAGRTEEARALTGREWLEDLDYDGPGSWDVAVLRYQEGGGPDELIRELRPVAELGKHDAPTAYTWMGIAYKKKGDLDAARGAYLKALDLCEKQHRRGVWPMLQLGIMELNARRFEKAAEWFRRARTESVTNDPRPAFYLGKALEGMGQVEEAWLVYEEALKLEGGASPAHSAVFTELHARMGGAAVKLGRRGDAARHLRESLRRAQDGPERVEALLGLGKLEVDAGDLERAAEWFRRADTEALPNDPRPASDLGRALQDMGRVEEAYRVYERILELEGDVAPNVSFNFTGLHKRMGKAAVKLGRREDAARHFREALRSTQSGPKRAGLLMALGKLEFISGDAEKAAEWFHRARDEASSSDPRPVFYLGLSLEKMGQAEGAWGLYEEALNLKGRTPPNVSFNFAHLHQQMGKVSEESGRTKEAVGHYAELLRLVPDHPERVNLRIKMGTMEEKLGHAEEAVKHLKELLRLSPDHPQGAKIRLKMAFMEEKLGRTEEAIRHFEEALRLAPDHPDRANIKARIEQLRSRPSTPRPAP